MRSDHARPVHRCLVLIAYDTPSNKRRRRMARIADDFGCRVQYSVFYAWLTQENIDKMHDAIDRIVDPEEDSVFIFSSCSRCQKSIITFGKAAFNPLPRYWIF